MFTERTWWGLLFAAGCGISIYMHGEASTKHYLAAEACREAVALTTYQEPYDLPYGTCRYEFSEPESKPHEVKIEALRGKENNHAIMGWVSGLVAFFLLVPVWMKWTWRFFLARLAEVSAAIRGN